MDSILGTMWWSALCVLVGWFVGSVYGFTQVKEWFSKK